MKKPIFILRLGIERLASIDRSAVGELQEEEMDILGCTIHGIGILSLVTTELSPSELVERYSQAASDLNDHGPVVAWNPRSEDASFNIFKDFKVVQDVIDQWEAHFDDTLLTIKTKDQEVCELSLDELLDKVGRTGRDSLTPLEFARLKSF
jgi:hypothetical protein